MTRFGPDGSHHQQGMTLDRNVDFMLWRCSIGSRIDETFDTFRDFARDNNIPFCAYHFVYQTERRVTSAGKEHNAITQARRVDEAVGDKSIPIMLDWESDGSQLPNWTDVQRVAAAIRALGYKIPLLYTGRWYWSSMGSPEMSGNGFDLINADYGNQKSTGEYEAKSRYKELGGDEGRGWNGYGGLVPSIWQFGSRIRCGDRYMDCNAIRLNVDLSRWFKIWKPAPPTQGSYTVADITVPNDYIKAAPPSINGQPGTDPVWWWSILYQNMWIDRPGTFGNGLKNEVEVIQRRLADVGYYDGPLDGVYGPKTEAALHRWLNK